MATSSLPEIETERLILRQFGLDDLDNWATLIFADPDVTRYLPKLDISPQKRAARAMQTIHNTWVQRGYGEWAVTNKTNGQFIGHCGLNYLAETDEVEVDYALSKNFWGKGIATEAARASVRFGFESAGLERIIGLTLPENIASQRVLQHIGFLYEKEAHYFGLDVLYYALHRKQFEVDDASLYKLK